MWPSTVTTICWSWGREKVCVFQSAVFSEAQISCSVILQKLYFLPPSPLIYPPSNCPCWLMSLWLMVRVLDSVLMVSDLLQWLSVEILPLWCCGVSHDLMVLHYTCFLCSGSSRSWRKDTNRTLWSRTSVTLSVNTPSPTLTPISPTVPTRSISRGRCSGCCESFLLISSVISLDLNFFF